MTEHLKVTVVLDGVVFTEEFVAPPGGRIASTILPKGRGMISVYDQEGHKIHAVGYARLERFEWTSD